MRVFKCDRCGKHYDGIGMLGARYGSRSLTLTVPDSRFNIEEGYFDLCDACFDEVKKWLGVKDEEENNGSVSN